MFVVPRGECNLKILNVLDFDVGGGDGWGFVFGDDFDSEIGGVAFVDEDDDGILLLDGFEKFVEMVHVDAHVQCGEVVAIGVSVELHGVQLYVEQQSSICVHHTQTDAVLGNLETARLDVVLEQLDEVLEDVRIMRLAMESIPTWLLLHSFD